MRPIIQKTDEKNNTIAITPIRPLPKIEEKNLSQELQSIFPDVNEIIKENCKEILQNNDLKIHIETGNIYYKNNDTNESIFEFMKNQQDSSKGKINFNLMNDGN